MAPKITKAQLELELVEAQKRIAALERKSAAVVSRAQDDDSHYRSLFEESPICLWEEDFSEAKTRLDQMKKSGVVDLREYMYSHPEFVLECASLVKVLDVNKGTLKLFEAKRKEDLLQNLDKVIPPESIPVFADELLALDRGQTTYFWEGINFTIKGRKIHVQLYLSVLSGFEESLARVIVSMMDVTGRRQAEEAQRHTEIYYRSLFEQTHDAVFIMDLKGNHLAVNQRAADMLGYKPYEILGLTISDTSAQAEQSGDVLKRVVNGEHIPTYERIFRKKDGTDICAEVNVELVKDVDGKPLHIQSVVRDITERKQAEDAVRKNEAQYRLLAENMSDIVWLMDMELQIVYISPSTTKIQGYTFEELHAMTLKEQMTTESYERAIALYTEALDTANLSQPNPKLVYEIDLEFYKKNGTTYWSNNTFKIILDENGQPVNVLGVGRDITNKKLAEDKLRKSEERYRTIAEDLPAMICRFKADGTITFVNSFYCNYFNTSYEELLGSSFLPLIPEPERELVQKKYLSLNQKKPFVSYEYKIVGVDGKESWQRWTDRALFNEHGEVVEYQSVGEDITERKQAEQQLAESEARFRALIAKTGDLIVVVDAQGNITFASPSSERLFGYKPEESIGRGFAEWVHPEDLEEATLAFQSRKQIPGAAPQNLKLRGLHKNGSWRYVEALGTNLLDDPAIKGIVLNIRDVTEQKRAELEKQVLYEIVQGLAFSNNLNEFLGLVHYSIDRVIPAKNMFVTLYNPTTELFEDAYSVDQYDEPLGPSKREGTLTAYIFRTGAPILGTQENFRELLVAGEAKLVGNVANSWIGVPLKTAGKTIGVMAIQDYETPDLYTEKDMAFLASISGQVASAVEQKLADEKLHESEKRFSNAFENAPIGMALVSPHGRFLKVNQALCDFLGYSTEELITLLFQNITHPDDLETDLQYLQQALAGAIQTYQMEKRYQHKLGHYVWGALNVSLVKNEEGAPLYFISQIKDITETKQTEEALRRAEEKYRTIFENSLEGIFQSTPAGQYITVNPALARMWGYDSPEDLLASITDIAKQVYINPAVRTEHMRLLKEHGGNLIGFEYQALCKNGSAIWVSESVSSIQDADGTLLYYEGTVENISSRKQAEEALSESESSLQAILRSTVDGILAVNTEGKVLFANERFVEMWMIPQELTDNKDDDILLQYVINQLTDPQGFLQRVQELYRSKEKSFDTLYFKDGKVFERFSRPLMQEEKLRGRVWSFRDITERKQAEETLRESEARLNRAQAVAQTGSWNLDVMKNILTWSAESYRIFGMESEIPLTLESFYAHIHPDDLDSVERAWQVALEGAPYDVEHRILVGGEVKWVRERAELETDTDGNTLRGIGTVQDITERKRAEAKLNESEQRYRSLFQDSPISLWEEDFSEIKKYLDTLKQQGVTDLRAYFMGKPEVVRTLNKTIKVLGVNQATLKMYRAEDLESFMEYIQEPGQGEMEHNIEDFIAIAEGRTGNSWDGADETISGEPLEISFSWSVVAGYENDYSKVIITTYDITERKIANDKIKESEQRYRSLFEDSPISLWEDDYSAVKQKLEELKSQGVVDFKAYFAEHPETAAECVSLIKVLDANQSSVKLFNASDKDDLLRNANKFLSADFIDSFELVNIANNLTHFEWEGVNRKLSGELMNVRLTWSVAPDYENDLSKVLISIIDITERKLAEAENRRQLSELETLYESGLAISRLITPAEIAQKVIEILDRRMNWHHIAIRQYKPETNSVKLIGFHQPGISAEEAEDHILKMNEIIANPGQGVSGWVTLNGKSLRVPNVKNDERYVETFPAIRSGLYVPLKVGEKVIGSISVESEKETAFTENDQRLLETLTGQAAIAIENANLFLMAQKEIIERQQAEVTLQNQTEELLQLNNRLEQRVKERTAEIEVTRKRLELAADAAGLGIWEWDIMTGNIIWDAQMHRIYGISPQEFDGKIDTQLKCVITEDQPILLGVAQEIMENKKTNFKIEHRIFHTHGDIHTLLEQGVAIFDERGLLERIIGIVNDVTPQKQAEQDLRESEAYAHLLFDAAPDPVSVAEVDGIMVDVNRLFEQQHRIQREEARGRHISELNIFPPEQLQKAKDYIMAIVAEREVPPVELDFYHPGGGMHTLEMHSYPIEVKGRLLVLSTSRDITIHKKAEESLRLSNAEMERALRVKDEFLANMSHELRTPLNAVLGMSESLEEQIAGPLNEKQLKYIRTISESGRHLLELINDILDLSKIEAGRLELSVSQISVSSLCEASLRMVKEQAQRKNQQVSLKVDPEVKIIMGDERRLKQSLVNLLSNAVKFTPNDHKVGVEVTGNVRNQTVTFTVWDEGIGMTPEELNLIFKPFVQLDSGLAREFSGTGLGLVLVAQMIRLHGGSVSVESKEGRGSRFSITLPWVDVEGTASAKKAPQETGAGPTSEEKRGGKILIVEDTDSIIMLLSEYLRYRGYQVQIARNGMEGVMLTKKERPDLILMDVMMPVMDGVEATKQIRAEKDLREIPIIALTALAMAGDRERCLQAGMNDYLSKPVQMKELENLIVKHINKKRAAPPS